MSYYDWYPESRPIQTDRDSRPAAGAAASPGTGGRSVGSETSNNSWTRAVCSGEGATPARDRSSR